MRADEREIPGASDEICDAPDLIEVRTSKRGRVPKREWPEEQQSQHRKKQRIQSPTPTSTQSSTQTATQNSSSKILETQDRHTPDRPDFYESNEPTQAKKRSNSKNKAPWEIKYEKLKRRSTKGARDYLLTLIGNEDYPEALHVPIVAPEVLLQAEFNVEDPLSIWREFVAEEDLIYIASHTNKNAADDRRQRHLERPFRKVVRAWKPVTHIEIGGYFGALFLLGTQGAASLCDNWKVSEDSPLYPIRSYISLTRFQQISRYIKINEPGISNDNLPDNEFMGKVDPLVTSFRARCRANLRPGTVFSIDEQLRRNRGRWKHALQISSKADSKGVKIYSLCAGYYCFDFLFASKVVGVPEARKPIPRDPEAKPFTPSETVILTLIEQLQEQHPNETLNLTLACDNFFTSHKLFKELKARGIAAYGTAKKGSGIPAQQVLLRDCTDKTTDYGLVCNSVYGGINHITFVDQKAVHMMTTAHDVKNEASVWRPATTRRNACLDRAREKGGYTELPYPQLSHDYNQGMNSCDVASQVWSYYSVSRYSHWRNWWPMLWIILDASIANVLYLYRLKGFTEANLSHCKLQTTIGLQLLRDPASVLRAREEQLFIIPLPKTSIRRPPDEHEWVQPGENARGDCESCKPPRQTRGRTRKALQEISTNISRVRGPRSSFKCRQCDVWLCKTSACWQRYHLNAG